MSRIKLEGIDPEALSILGGLKPPNDSYARLGLRALADRGYDTGLNALLAPEAYNGCTSKERVGLSQLWKEAMRLNKRTVAIPRKNPGRAANTLPGVAPSVLAYLNGKDSAGNERFPSAAKTGMRYLLAELVGAGLPANLDVDMSDPKVLELIGTILLVAQKGQLPCGPRTGQAVWIKSGWRQIFEQAIKDKVRTQPIHELVGKRHQYVNGAFTELFKRLPKDDQRKVTKVEDYLLKLCKNTQLNSRRGDKTARTSDGGGGMALSISQERRGSMISQLHSIFHQAEREQWHPFTLEGILAPQNVRRWCFQGTTPGGAPLHEATILIRTTRLADFLRFGYEAGVELVNREQLKGIEDAVTSGHDDPNWNVAPKQLVNGQYKFFPLLEQVTSLFTMVDEVVSDAGLRYAQGSMSRKDYWQEVRDWCLFICKTIAMWRMDTASTIDLSRLVVDPHTGSHVWPDGSMRVGSGARSKQSSFKKAYYAETLYIPPLAVHYIAMLLKIEGRSIDNPLLEGERPAYLSVANGDRWGKDQLLAEDREVIPLWRLDPDRPEPLSYDAVSSALERVRGQLGWHEGVAHTCRVAGAIWWRYVLGASMSTIMTIGLWESEDTLKECYAKMNLEDEYHEAGRLAPSPEMLPRAALDQNVSGTMRALVQITQTTNWKNHVSDTELEHVIRELERGSVALSKAVATRRGKAHRPPEKALVALDELVRVDRALRPLYKRGLAELLGRAVFARDRAEQDIDTHLLEPTQSDAARRVVKAMHEQKGKKDRGGRAA